MNVVDQRYVVHEKKKRKKEGCYILFCVQTFIFSYLADVQVLNVDTLQWSTPFIRHPVFAKLSTKGFSIPAKTLICYTDIIQLTPPRGLHTATVINDEQILIFGGIF